MGLGRLPTFHFLFFFSILRILGILVVRCIIIKKLMIVFELKKSFFYRLHFLSMSTGFKDQIPPFLHGKIQFLFQCLSVSTMDTSRNRTWLRRMASLLWLVFLFVGVSAGTLEKLHEGKSFPIFIQIPLVYFVQLKYIHFVINLKKI